MPEFTMAAIIATFIVTARYALRPDTQRPTATGLLSAPERRAGTLRGAQRPHRSASPTRPTIRTGRDAPDLTRSSLGVLLIISGLAVSGLAVIGLGLAVVQLLGIDLAP